MKICFLPLGDQLAASSRIRVYTLHDTLLERGISSRIGYHADADVVVIQKRVNRGILRLAKRAQRQGQLVVYDVDDFGEGLEYCCSTANLERIVKIADLVTTDTRGHLDYLAAHHPRARALIVPDCIDYFPRACATLPQQAVSPLRVLWFGGISNVALFEKYAAALAGIPDVQVVVATSANAQLRERYPAIEFAPWSLSGFVSVLQGCHLTCLMHDGSEIDKAKSNNKMITSICWGVPAVVSRTPEYQRTALEAGVGYALFGGEQDLAAVVESLRPAQRRAQYLESAQQKVWEQYSSGAVADLFLEEVERCLARRALGEGKRGLGALLRERCLAMFRGRS